MTKSIASAPGKMILLGEFAVLDNAPAIVLALNRRAQVTVTSAASNCVSAPEVSEHDVRFEIDDNRNVTWVDVDPAASVRLELLAQVITRFWPGYPVHIATDTSAFYEDGIKMGFGSSAALTVAAAAALSGTRPPLDKLIETHCAAQDGRGSGFDIAASWHGGVIQYRKKPLEAKAMKLPDGLHLRCIWTGQPASTKAFLRGLDALGERRAAINALIESATKEVARLDQSPASWLLAVQNYSQALKEFAAATRLPIYAGGHTEVDEIADNNRVAYKPSGAGGGDLGVAISDDATAIQAFTDDLKATSVRVLRMGIDDKGLALN